MKKTFFTGLFLLIASAAIAQPATPNSKIGWDQDAATATEAQAYVYKHYSDGATTGVPLSNIICTGTAPTFQCQATIPAYNQGNHTIQLTASNVAGESLKSSPLNFTFVNVPAIPRNLRIIAESLKIRNKLARG